MNAADELRALLEKPQAGLRLIHLHLGRLALAPSREERAAIRQALREFGKTADAWRLFDMPDGDLLMLYQGAHWTAADAAARKAQAVLIGARMTGSNPYGTRSEEFFDIVQLTENTAPVLRYLDNLR